MAGAAFIPMEDEVVVSDGATALILLIFFAVLAAVIFLIIHFIRAGRMKRLVKKTSPAYLALAELNKKYEQIYMRFQQDYTYSFTAKSKQNFDHFFTSKRYNEGLESILTEKIDVEYLANAIQWNKDKYKEYEQEYYAAVVYTTEKKFQELSLPRRVSFKRYSKFERRLDLQKMGAQLSFQVIIKVYYNSPGGRNHYYNSITLPEKEVINRYNRIIENRQNQTEAQKQRSLLTPSLRYEVMKRDGFKCVLCGRTQADGVTLEVDHIMPVAKGGKTEIGNLRTLCRDCNRGKSDTYDAAGVN